MSRARRQEPPAPAPRKPAKAFAPGDRVLILDGLSKGITAIVVGRWPDIGGMPAWRLDLPDCRDRVIREDFLAKVVGVAQRRSGTAGVDAESARAPVSGAWFEVPDGTARADFLERVGD